MLIFLVSLSSYGQYLKESQQKYFRNDSNDGKNHYQRIDDNVIQLNKMIEQHQLLKDQVQKNKDELKEIKERSSREIEKLKNEIILLKKELEELKESRNAPNPSNQG